MYHAQCSMACGTTSASRPPGRRARARLAKAAAGSSKNMTPKWLMTTSTTASQKGWTWASPTTNVTLARPSAAAASAAWSTIWRDRSMPRAVTPGAARAARRVASPFPHPTSSTNSSAAMAAAVSSGPTRSASAGAARAWDSAQLAPSGPFQASACEELGREDDVVVDMARSSRQRDMNTTAGSSSLAYARCMPELWSLRILVTVAEHGSFSAAADALVLTQPAVSRQIAGLDREAGVRLFRRVARGVGPHRGRNGGRRPRPRRARPGRCLRGHHAQLLRPRRGPAPPRRDAQRQHVAAARRHPPLR